jgi:hypothetical protein
MGEICHKDADICHIHSYIGEGNPPSNYETDAGYQGGAAGGCLYDVRFSFRLLSSSRPPNSHVLLSQANTGALVTDSDAGYCAQNAITCTVQKRDIAKIALDSKRPSGKLVRDEMSEGMVAMRGIMSSKRRSN